MEHTPNESTKKNAVSDVAYALLKTAPEKTGSLDKFRKQTHSQGVLGALIAEIEKLTV